MADIQAWFLEQSLVETSIGPNGPPAYEEYFQDPYRVDLQTAWAYKGVKVDVFKCLHKVLEKIRMRQSEALA